MADLFTFAAIALGAVSGLSYWYGYHHGIKAMGDALDLAADNPPEPIGTLTNVAAVPTNIDGAVQATKAAATALRAASALAGMLDQFAYNQLTHLLKKAEHDGWVELNARQEPWINHSETRSAFLTAMRANGVSVSYQVRNDGQPNKLLVSIFNTGDKWLLGQPVPGYRYMERSKDEPA